MLKVWSGGASVSTSIFNKSFNCSVLAPCPPYPFLQTVEKIVIVENGRTEPKNCNKM